jgi:hypothetical protein
VIQYIIIPESPADKFVNVPFGATEIDVFVIFENLIPVGDSIFVIVEIGEDGVPAG